MDRSCIKGWVSKEGKQIPVTDEEKMENLKKKKKKKEMEEDEQE